MSCCLPLTKLVQMRPRQQPACCQWAVGTRKIHRTSHRRMPVRAASKEVPPSRTMHSARCHPWQRSAHLCTSTSTVPTSSRQHRRKVMRRSGGVSGPTATPRHSGAADSSTASSGGVGTRRYPAHRQPGWPVTRRMTARPRLCCRLLTIVLAFEKPCLSSPVEGLFSSVRLLARHES